MSTDQVNAISPKPKNTEIHIYNKDGSLYLSTYNLPEKFLLPIESSDDDLINDV